MHHRDALDVVQKELREVPGVTAIVYDQTCAAEARRLRKRGEFPDPDRRIVINEAVCEGCGDCSVQSNCISVEPVETELGRKRRINQSSCNKDYSCLLGYCPSFVTVTGGGRLRKAASRRRPTGSDDVFAGCPRRGWPTRRRPSTCSSPGIGGTGVITVGALLGMAAHLEGKGTSLLDVTGLAQKNGPVASHIRIATRPEDLHATRIAVAAADLVLGCDIVVTTSARMGWRAMSPERTTAVVNSDVAPTADFATNADLDLSSKGMEDAIDRCSRRRRGPFPRGDPARHRAARRRDRDESVHGRIRPAARADSGFPRCARTRARTERPRRRDEQDRTQLGPSQAHDLERVRELAKPGMRGASERVAPSRGTRSSWTG